MKKFVVAYINQFDNELLQGVVEAETTLEAALKYLAEQQDTLWEDEEITSYEQLIDVMYNMDSNISVIEV